MTATIDLDFVRRQFPALSGEWTFLDNAGGSQVLGRVVDRAADYLTRTNVQLGASYDVSEQAEARVDEACRAVAEWIGAEHSEEVVFGSSTSQLMTNLALSMSEELRAGDEVVLTTCDHEANITPWLRLQRQGVVIRWWRPNADTDELHVEDLQPLLCDRTRLVCFTATSNVVGSIHPVAEVCSLVRECGARSCIDAVALAPHRQLEVGRWDVDFLAFSVYKVYGPHQAVLYGKRQHLHELPAINHFFIEEVPYKLQPGNVNYELVHATGAVPEYLAELGGSSLARAYGAMAHHEEELAERLLGYLRERRDVRLLGRAESDRAVRVPTISFALAGRRSSEIPPLLDPHRIAVRWGDFYARRLIDDLGLSAQDGIVRVSAVHYNTLEEMDRLVETLDRVLPIV